MRTPEPHGSGRTAARAQAVAAVGPAAAGPPPSEWSEVPGLSVNTMCSVLSDHGADPAPLLRAARIPLVVRDDAEQRIGWQQELMFQQLFAEHTADTPEIWVETGRRYLYPIFDAFGMAMIAAPTLRHWRDTATSLDTNFSVGRYRARDFGPASTGVEVRLPPDLDPNGAFYRFTIVRDVAAVATFLDDLWQGPIPLERLELPLPSVLDVLNGVVEAPLVPGADAVRWVFPRSVLDVALPRSNPMLHELNVGRARRSKDWLRSAAQLDEQVAAILGRPGHVGMSLQRVAAELNMSTRTLQRKLDEYEVSFRELRDRARLREACHLLTGTDVSIAEIAELLGYLEVASFSNAFRRWTGQSPSAYRLRPVGPAANT